MISVHDQLLAAAQTLGDQASHQILQGLAAWHDHRGCQVVVCGEFKRGKSTLVNALLDTDMCPTDVLPATAVPMALSYAETPQATIEFQGGHREAISATRDGLGRLSVGTDFPTADVRLVRIGLPSTLLRPGLVLIDTPGVNDLSQQRADVTFGFLPLADVAIVVLDATAPVTRTEACFLQEQVFPAMRDRMVFVLGKADRLDEEELEEAMDGARSRLSALLGLAPPLIPLSALRAARGQSGELTPLREAITQAAASAQSSRDVLLQTRLATVARRLLLEAEARLTAAEASEDELLEARLQLQEAQQRIGASYEAFQHYIDLYGRKTLHELVGASLRHHRKELLDELLHQVDLLDGKIDDFVRKRVPHVVGKSIKTWSDVKGAEIQQFLEKLIQRVAHDYAAAFAAPLELSAMPRSLQTPAFQSTRRAEATSEMEEQVMMHLLPTAIPMAAGAMLFGPVGSAMGMVLGSVAGASMRQAQLISKKEEATAAITRDVTIVFDHFSGAIATEIDRWFDQLEAMLRSGLQQRSDAVIRILSSGRETDQAAWIRLRDTLRQCLSELHEEVIDERSYVR